MVLSILGCRLLFILRHVLVMMLMRSRAYTAAGPWAEGSSAVGWPSSWLSPITSTNSRFVAYNDVLFWLKQFLLPTGIQKCDFPGPPQSSLCSGFLCSLGRNLLGCPVHKQSFSFSTAWSVLPMLQCYSWARLLHQEQCIGIGTLGLLQ